MECNAMVSFKDKNYIALHLMYQKNKQKHFMVNIYSYLCIAMKTCIFY